MFWTVTLKYNLFHLKKQFAFFALSFFTNVCWYQQLKITSMCCFFLYLTCMVSEIPSPVIGLMYHSMIRPALPSSPKHDRARHAVVTQWDFFWKKYEHQTDTLALAETKTQWDRHLKIVSHESTVTPLSDHPGLIVLNVNADRWLLTECTGMDWYVNIKKCMTFNASHVWNFNSVYVKTLSMTHRRSAMFYLL